MTYKKVENWFKIHFSAVKKYPTGKILEYRINIDTKILVKDYLTEDEILNQNYSSSASYRVQDQYSETLRLQTKALDNLINKTYQN